MMDWFRSGGVIMWPLLAIAVGVILSAGRAALKIRADARAQVDPGAEPAGGASRSRGVTEGVLVPVLFWGGMAVLVGALGTVTGLVIMGTRIAAAGGAGSGLVWGGIATALTSLAFGLLVFLLSGLLWLSLDAWAGRRPARSGPGAASVPALVVCGALAAGCGAGDDGTFTVADSAGITVAANLGPDRALGAAPERLAALLPPDSALTAMPWGVAADPATGRIFVADGSSERVVVFDADGAYLRTLGRAGEGPGEFRSPTALALDADGVLSVWDARRGVISRWTAGGELLDERPAPVSYWGPGFAVDGEGVVVVTQATTGRERRQSLVHAAGPGEARELFAVTRELVPLELGGGSMPAPRIFAPDLIWAAAGDTVLVLNGPGYRIDAYVDGRPALSIRRPIEPIAVTSELAKARVSAGPYRGFMRRAGITPEQLVAAVGHEERASPIEWLATGPSGELWVSRGAGLPVPERVDVFGLPEGRYRGTFEAPGFPVAFLRDGRFVALEVSDLGAPALALYRLAP